MATVSLPGTTVETSVVAVSSAVSAAGSAAVSVVVSAASVVWAGASVVAVEAQAARLSTMTAASSRASNFFIFISSCDEWFVGSVWYAHNYTHEMHIVKRRCKKNTPSLSCKTSMKADKMHKT